MERIIDVAQFIYDEYKKMANEVIDEMKLHKLLYFAQRESYAITGSPLFDGQLQGWRYGPVSPEVRMHYTKDGMNAETQEINIESAYIVKNVLIEYGAIASWKLSQITHAELSWQNSRIGLASNQNGNRPITNDDIKEDAKKVRPYDHVWDMYYDEFDDVIEEAVES